MMISLKDISFSYPHWNKTNKENDLFHKLNLEIKSGTICGLLGKNGMGKTTLLRIISGLLFPQDGDCIILRNRPQQRSPQFLREIYFLPEEFHVPPITIDTYLDLFSPFYPHFDRAACLKFLQEFELPINTKQKLNTLSYGQKKKFLIAFALATNCQLLLLDEPTNGLDIPSKGQFRKLLTSNIDEQRTIIISTHQVRDLQNMLDTIVIIDEGKIIFNHSLFAVADKFTFTQQSELPHHATPLYYEKILGGYMIVQTGEPAENYMSEVDLEILFNMVTNDAAKINRILGA
jgi:ABC-2 type transport system ATP-binding protein